MIQYEGEETMVIQYNKLVRDRIPEIIESSGKSCTTEILSDEDYLRMIDAKLDEELAEYHKDQNIFDVVISSGICVFDANQFKIMLFTNLVLLPISLFNDFILKVFLTV